MKPDHILTGDFEAQITNNSLYFEVSPYKHYKQRQHEKEQILYVIFGQAEINIMAPKIGRIQLSTGDKITIAPNTTYWIKAERPTKFIRIEEQPKKRKKRWLIF